MVHLQMEWAGSTSNMFVTSDFHLGSSFCVVKLETEMSNHSCCDGKCEEKRTNTKSKRVTSEKVLEESL